VHPLLQLMPEVLLVRGAETPDPSLVMLLETMAAEIAAQRIGGATVMARLADTVITRVIRGWVETRSGETIPRPGDSSSAGRGDGTEESPGTVVCARASGPRPASPARVYAFSPKPRTGQNLCDVVVAAPLHPNAGGVPPGWRILPLRALATSDRWPDATELTLRPL
jgi:hypothetical protein